MITKTEQIIGAVHRDTKERIYHNFIDIVEDEMGTPTSIKFKNEDKFNFAFDLVDELSRIAKVKVPYASYQQGQD